MVIQIGSECMSNCAGGFPFTLNLNLEHRTLGANSYSSPATSPSDLMDDGHILPLTVGVVTGFSLVMIAALVKRRFTRPVI
jgi:hypothetical protein